MNKFYGAVGYAETEDINDDGVWQEQITERKYAGDILKFISRSRDGENLNRNIVPDNRISIVADPFAYDNFHAIRYVQWMEAKWQVTSVEVQRPRLILTIGGVYNEQTS